MPQKYFANATVKAQEGDDGTARIYGQAVEYGRVGYFGWGFRLAVAQGAAVESLKNRKDSADRDILALVAHDSAKVLGRTNQGTLEFTATETGVDYSIDINMADPEAVSAYEKVKRGEYTAASIGFYILESHEEVMPDNSLDADAPGANVSVEMAEEIDIIEVSVLAHGAFGGATSLAANAHYETRPAAGTSQVPNEFNTVTVDSVTQTADGKWQLVMTAANIRTLTKVRAMEGPETEAEADDDEVEADKEGEPEVEAEVDDEPEVEAEADEPEVEAEADEPEVEAEVDDEPEVEAEADEDEVEGEPEVEAESDDTTPEDITEDVADEDTVSIDAAEDSSDESDAAEGEPAESGEADAGDGPDRSSAGASLTFAQAQSQAMSLGLINLIEDKEPTNA